MKAFYAVCFRHMTLSVHQLKVCSDCNVTWLWNSLLWSLNFLLSKKKTQQTNNPIKETRVLICVLCTGAGDSCCGVCWLLISSDTMKKTNLWWFIKRFQGMQVSLPFLPLLPLAKQRSGWKQGWSGRRNYGSSGWNPREAETLRFPSKVQNKTKTHSDMSPSTLHTRGLRRSGAQQEENSVNKKFICL